MSTKPTRFTQWLMDLRWAMNMMRCRRLRRCLSFSGRIAFDEAVRPRLKWPAVIAYPDAIYHVTIDDVVRAMRAVEIRDWEELP